jgi:isoaspartyl peptidase/L-asparaginase-like protein (Ntn-hydrolase superfamily)
VRGVPLSATAVAISLTGIGAPSAAYASAFAYGAQLPNTYTVQVQGAQAATAGATVAVAEGKINVFVNKTMHVIGDVTGYYAPQISGAISLGGTINYATSRVVSSTSTGVGMYSVTFDCNVSRCAVTAAPYGSGSYIVNAYPSGNTIQAYAYTTTTGAAVNLYWQFHVTC